MKLHWAESILGETARSIDVLDVQENFTNLGLIKDIFRICHECYVLTYSKPIDLRFTILNFKWHTSDHKESHQEARQCNFWRAIYMKLYFFMLSYWFANEMTSSTKQHFQSLNFAFTTCNNCKSNLVIWVTQSFRQLTFCFLESLEKQWGGKHYRFSSPRSIVEVEGVV